jgi:hypothetical protein
VAGEQLQRDPPTADQIKIVRFFALAEDNLVFFEAHVARASYKYLEQIVFHPMEEGMLGQNWFKRFNHISPYSFI